MHLGVPREMKGTPPSRMGWGKTIIQSAVHPILEGSARTALALFRPGGFRLSQALAATFREEITRISRQLYEIVKS